MKVRKDKLQAAIHKHVKQAEAKFESDKEKYAQKHARAKERYLANLERYVERVRKGGEVETRYDLEHILGKDIEWPSEPKEPNRHVELLVKLDLAEDAILTVDDHSDYMKFLDGKCVC